MVFKKKEKKKKEKRILMNKYPAMQSPLLAKYTED